MKKRKGMILPLLALVMLALMLTKGTLAYFTARDASEGSVPVKLRWETELHEELEGNDKHLVVTNTGEVPVIVRVRIFASGVIESIDDVDGMWKSDPDGWWYYDGILAPGRSTGELYVKLKDALPGTETHVTVVHESERVIYKTNDELLRPDGWNRVPGEKEDET